MNDAILMELIPGLRRLDFQVALMLTRMSTAPCPELMVAAACASLATGQGHTCLPLAVVANWLQQLQLSQDTPPLSTDLPSLRAKLLATGIVKKPGMAAPLFLDRSNRLYLRRYYLYETHIAERLRQLAQETLAVDQPRAQNLLSSLFSSAAPPESIDWQKTAAALALLKRLVIISGGPGTGKTYTVARILAALSALATDGLRIGLSAPTGKAALRLQESIGAAKKMLPKAMTGCIPEEASTLHRLLGYRTSPPGFRHTRENPLHVDLLILDEASMIDVGLMAALLEALPMQCRIILLGDRDQLASVEAGNLFGDLCGGGAVQWSPELTDQLGSLTGYTFNASPALKAASPLSDNLVHLQVSRRFRADSGIHALAQLVNRQKTGPCTFADFATFTDLSLQDPAEIEPRAWLRTQILTLFAPLFACTNPEEALQRLNQRRILCALRNGPWGVEGINQLAETTLRHAGHMLPGEQYYRGMPIIIRRNDYQQELFNGDTGILWPAEDGLLYGWFPGKEGQIRRIAMVRLPAWQTSYAMTVHKSQGSEFQEVLLVLPREECAVLTRELLYTGITRTQRKLTILADQEQLNRIITRRVIRYSGLRDRLAGKNNIRA